MEDDENTELYSANIHKHICNNRNKIDKFQNLYKYQRQVFYEQNTNSLKNALKFY